jgi:hypothetical protein
VGRNHHPSVADPHSLSARYLTRRWSQQDEKAIFSAEILRKVFASAWLYAIFRTVRNAQNNAQT